MDEPVKGRRAYDASRRREAARETRHRVLVAARALFLGRGFAATTMADVAQAAGVAVQTVYSAVGGKAALLKEVMDVSIAGDDEPVAMPDRPEIRAVQAETDGRRKLVRYATHLRQVQERTADLDAVLRAAADVDPEVRRLVDTLEAQRLTGMTLFAQDLAGKRLLRRGVTVATAADVLSAHMDPRTYRYLVRDRGWSGADYERWYVEVTAAMLLRPES
jgi:TetR/AcrR family transcriptional regulator, regulator of autoinduction and epiphytic fitness